MLLNERNSSANSSAEINMADTTWIIVASCLVFLMIPGVGYYYGGITQKKNQLTILITSGLSIAVVAFQWFFWGYSLSLSETGSSFIGNLDHFALRGVGNVPHVLAPSIPSNAYMLFQGMFAAITPCLAFGAAAERTSLSAYLILLFIWSTVVYDFVTYWTWAPHGWLHEFEVLDYAGGTPVHVVSGFSALAYALAVGPRKTVNLKHAKPSNVSDVFFGTAILWFGWFGFNGGSETAINARAVNAIFVSNLSAGTGGLTWMFLEMLRHKTRKMSLNAFCCGAIAGLVTVTPATGFINPYFALIFGFIGSIFCFCAVDLKKFYYKKYDDACDVFGVHGVGGVIGCLLTGIFAEKSVAMMSGGSEIKGGWVDGNYMQFLYQLLSIVVAGVWAFVLTYLILRLIDFIPFIKLRLNIWEETAGTDLVEMGESAYGHDLPDYIKLKQERDTMLQK